MIFPKPSGDYNVGLLRTEYNYTGLEPDILPLTIFYPIDKPMGKRARYTFKEALFNLPIYRLKTEFYLDNNISTKKEKYPVLIYNHGYRSYEMSNSILCGELASRGFIVVGIGHTREATAVKLLDGTVISLDRELDADTERAEQDGGLQRIIKELSEVDLIVENDELFIKSGELFNELHNKQERMEVWKDRIIKTADYLNILNNENEILKGKFDLDIGLGITGHSFGGASGILACREDERFVCGINMDGANLEYNYGANINKPFMTIGAVITSKLLRGIYLNNECDSYQLILKNTDHMSFSDLNFFPLISKIIKIPLGTMDKNFLNNTVVKYHTDFFNKYLLNMDIEIEEPNNSEIILNKNIKSKEGVKNE